MEREVKKFTIFIDSDLHKRIKMKAAELEMTMTELVVLGIKKMLEEKTDEE